MDLPVGWMIAAKFAAELLSQEFLRPAGTRVARLPVRLDPGPHPPRRLLLLRRNEAALPHLLEHQMAAIQGAVVIRPGRQRRWRADQTGNERRFRQRDGIRRLPK